MSGRPAALKVPSSMTMPLRAPAGLSAHTGNMSSQAKLTIRVGSNRGSSSIQYSTAGRYISLPTNTIGNSLPRQPIQPTSSAKAFWLSVIAVIQADINAMP